MVKQVILDEARFINLMAYNKYKSDLVNHKIIWLKDDGDHYTVLCPNAFMAFGGDSIPKDKFDLITPKFVRNGFSFAIEDSKEESEPVKRDEEPLPDFSGNKRVENPCFKCKLRGICDDDYCAKR